MYQYNKMVYCSRHNSFFIHFSSCLYPYGLIVNNIMDYCVTWLLSNVDVRYASDSKNNTYIYVRCIKKMLDFKQI